MKKNFTKFFYKTPLIILPFLFIATGCHTPEDLREIGPQQELIEAEWSPEGISSPSLSDPQNLTIPSQGGANGGDEGGIQTHSLTRLPVIMSRSRKTRCRGC